MSAEDAIVNQLIEGNTRDDNVDRNFQPEVGYNDYGDKGVVDLVCDYFLESIDVYTDSAKWIYGKFNEPVLHESVLAIDIFEVKSEYAVNESTGANEILRQFNRHMDHFFAGCESFQAEDYDSIRFGLVFEDTDEVKKHVASNFNMYNSNSGFVQLWDASKGQPSHDVHRVGRKEPDWVKEHKETPY